MAKLGPQLADAQKFAPELAVIEAHPALFARLTALSKVPPTAIAYLTADGAAVQKAAAQTASQWKTWCWICFGRWKPSDAKLDA